MVPKSRIPRIVEAWDVFLFGEEAFVCIFLTSFDGLVEESLIFVSTLFLGDGAPQFVPFIRDVLFVRAGVVNERGIH